MAEATTVNSTAAPEAPDGDLRLAAGERVALRIWRDETPTADKAPSRHDYEVVGYVLSGRAELDVDGRTLTLKPGDSWLVPAGAEHRYRIVETFSAVEAVAPPPPKP